MNRVSAGTMTVVTFAILVGLGGAYMVRQHLSQPPLPPLSELGMKKGPEKITVPIAGVELTKGRKIAFHDIVMLSFTPEEFAKSKFAGQPFMGNSNLLFGRVLNRDMPKGSVFLPDHFYADGYGPGVAERLQPGFRAVTVPIENVGAVTGFAEPGSIVDVLFRSKEETARPEVTLTLLEQVEVLALENNVLPGKRVDVKNQATVTLAVTPAQAKILKVVEGRGEISLTLRNPDDQQNFQFAPVNLPHQVQVENSNDNLSLLQQVNFTGALNSSSSSSTKGAEADILSSLSLVLDDASERVTIDDLLGRTVEKKQMTLYKAGAREVLEFEEATRKSDRILQNGSQRVVTPIAGRAPVRQGTEKVALDYIP